MSIKDFPRLIIKVLRGTVRHPKLMALRSASARTNSSAKEDLCIFNKPKIRGLKNAGVLALMAVMVLLLKRISRFIVKITLAMRKMFSSNSPPLKPYLPGPDVPKFIANLIQRDPFPFFLPSPIPSVDPSRKSSVRTAEALPFSSKNAFGTEPRSGLRRSQHQRHRGRATLKSPPDSMELSISSIRKQHWLNCLYIFNMITATYWAQVDTPCHYALQGGHRPEIRGQISLITSARFSFLRVSGNGFPVDSSHPFSR